MYLDSFLFAQFSELVSCGGHVGNNYGDVLFVVVWWIVVVVVVVVVLDWLGWVNLCCHWLRAHAGNWQCCSAVLVCWSSLSSFVLCGRNYFGPVC